MSETHLKEQINKAFGFKELPDNLEKRMCNVCHKTLIHKKINLNGFEFWNCHGFQHEKNLQKELDKIKANNLYMIELMELKRLDKKYMKELKEMEVK